MGTDNELGSANRPANHIDAINISRREALGRVTAYMAPAIVALLVSEPTARAQSMGNVFAVDQAAHTFTCGLGDKRWIYKVTERTIYQVGDAEGAWADIQVGAFLTKVDWHREGDVRIAEKVYIRKA